MYKIPAAVPTIQLQYQLPAGVRNTFAAMVPNEFTAFPTDAKFQASKNAAELKASAAAGNVVRRRAA